MGTMERGGCLSYALETEQTGGPKQTCEENGARDECWVYWLSNKMGVVQMKEFQCIGLREKMSPDCNIKLGSLCPDNERVESRESPELTQKNSLIS